VCRLNRSCFVFLLPLIWFGTSLLGVPYTARISGVHDPILQRAMEKASLTISSTERETPSRNALRLRALNDVERLNAVAIYNGYYDCHIEPSISDQAVLDVDFAINLGGRFSFGILTIDWNDQDVVLEDLARQGQDQVQLAKGPSPTDVPSFRSGNPATGKAILDIDTNLIKALRTRAFAFAKIVSKTVRADRSTEQVDIALVIQTGPITRFGPTQIVGNHNVKPAVFEANQEWKEGDLYSPAPLEATESSLQHSGLFQSVQVEEAKELGNDWSLPITINVAESKPRTIGAGLSYTTTYGAGLSAEWEHRNIDDLGRKLSTNIELWQKMRTASLTYTLPTLGQRDRRFFWVLEYDHQHYLPFSSSAYKLSPLVDRQLTPRTDFVYGICFERLESTGIIGHRLYHLVKIPLQLKWSNANSPLDPTRGFVVNVHVTPSYQVLEPHYRYFIHASSLSAYRSIADDRITFAARLGIGNIFGAGKNTIPLPDRFFGGSQNSLRGYKTGSVSPLNAHHEPVGGRSILTGSLEVRTRTKGLGWVAFYDAGNVYRSMLPEAQRQTVLQSVGLGARYSTPIGPLRLDIAFPLQRRKHIDPMYQIYFSIGQAF
jgi:translocation and assembly module TamA